MTSLHLVEWSPVTGVADLRSIVAGSAADDVVVLHTGPPPDATTIDGLVQALSDADAAASFSPLTDAVKEVDGAHRVVAAPDRSRLGHLGFPQAVRVAAIGGVLDEPDAVLGEGPVRLLLGRGARVRVVRPAD